MTILPPKRKLQFHPKKMPKIIRFNDEYHYWYVNEVQKNLTTRDYNSMNNKTLLILNSIDSL